MPPLVTAFPVLFAQAAAWQIVKMNMHIPAV
jgi:hypothetical protein